RYLVGIGIAASLVSLIMIYMVLYSPHERSGTGSVSIPDGASLTQTARLLESADVISSSFAFKALAFVMNKQAAIKAGTYIFPRRNTIKEVLDIVTLGSHQRIIRIQFPEGIRVAGIADTLERRFGIPKQKTISLARDRSFIASLGFSSSTLEGYLLPDTYSFTHAPGSRELLSVMANEMKKFLSVDSIKKRIHRSGMTLHEVLTLASIVEGETGISAERPRIAGVYLNRLRRGMLLQADPTVQYALPDGPRRLLLKDYKHESPYNTYLHPGLPPTPVNNPGRASILAVLYPEHHDFLYFVADGKGGHVFSRTLKEHNIAVRAYRNMMRRRPN
ncbi:MAG: endolytic transglycosylase MltG, partial [Chlorobi bacterium]|nr:endolytic transglycosylase MltG [Chlorobiota bacterium]